ncbi:MAG: 5'-3' exonuclease H3TH domain-containing protein [Candidatus Limnocylindria bacterium]
MRTTSLKRPRRGSVASSTPPRAPTPGAAARRVRRARSASKTGADGPDRPLLLLDCFSLLYRAYHAVPSLQAPDQRTQVNAVLGFLNYLSRLVPDRQPGRLVVALDADWRPAFRVEALPSYKVHRVAPEGQGPDEVEQQLPALVEILAAFGLSTGEAEGYEAEDVIATLARGSKGQVEIVTGDRDCFALVRPGRVRILYTLKGVSQLAIVDEAWITAKYGIPGDRYLDYALLRGDPSDGLPGVPGIGDKTASTLLRRYGSLEALLAAPDLAPPLRVKLKNAKQYLEAARRVVAPVDDVRVIGGDGAIPRQPAHPRRLVDLAKRYGLERSVDRLVRTLMDA